MLSTVSYRAGIFCLRPEQFGVPAGEAEAQSITSAKLVVVGELHAYPAVVEFERRVVEGMLASRSEGRVHLVLEHFSFDMQPLLDDFGAGRSSFAQLVTSYEATGTEGHDIPAYKPLLSLAYKEPRLALHAGFIPRSYARLVMRESLTVALEAAKTVGYVAPTETCEATEAHYNFFESLISGRDMHSPTPPSDQFRRMFPAQVIKDAAMAHRVATLFSSGVVEPADRVVVICGVGHSGYDHGVPERIFAALPALQTQTVRVWCAMAEDAAQLAPAPKSFGPADSPLAADLLLAFAETPVEVARAASESAASADSAESAKRETESAYDRVGATAAQPGDGARARLLMRRLGYTEEEIEIAGDDAHNFQGVRPSPRLNAPAWTPCGHAYMDMTGSRPHVRARARTGLICPRACCTQVSSPHGHASLRPGEVVLDVGSGLGIDSFIAAARVGPAGRVIGVDLSAKEVAHASGRAAARAAAATRAASSPAPLDFITADLEALPLGNESVDVVLSNGAFCLAPDKPRAFAELYRVLRPGGRFAVCTSTIKGPSLAEGVQWPLCMRMFADVAELEPMCAAVGFADVLVDRSDPAMQFELELPTAERGSAEGALVAEQRNRVHVGSAEFEHLRDFDLNAICERVVVTGRKP